MKSIKFFSVAFCILLASVAFAQNGAKQANFQSVEIDLQKLNNQNVNYTNLTPTPEQLAARAQRQQNRANVNFQTRANQQVVVNQNIQAPPGSQNGSITVKPSVNPTSNLTPNTPQLTQAQKQQRIKTLLSQIKNQ